MNQAEMTLGTASLEKGMNSLKKDWALRGNPSQIWAHKAVREVILGASITWLFGNRQGLLRLKQQVCDVNCCPRQHSFNLYLGHFAPLAGVRACKSNGKLYSIRFPPPGVPQSSRSGFKYRSSSSGRKQNESKILVAGNTGGPVDSRILGTRESRYKKSLERTTGVRSMWRVDRRTIKFDFRETMNNLSIIISDRTYLYF